MHSHDESLIAALAEGALDPDRVATAEAELGECARCAAELTAQRSALAAMANLIPAALADEERARIHEAVASAVGLPLSSPDPEPERRRRREVPWGAIAVAGLSLAAIVAIVPLAGLLTTAGEDDTLDLAVTTEIAAEVPEAGADRASADEGVLQAPVSDESVMLEDAGESETNFSSDGSDGAGEAGATSPSEERMADPVTTEAPTTTAAATTATTAPAVGTFETTLDGLEQMLQSGAVVDLIDDVRTAPCRPQARDELDIGVQALDLLVDVTGSLGIAYLDAEESSIVVLALEDCSLLATLP